MISTNDFHTGLTIELDGDIFTVVEFQHVKPGKGSAFVRSKLKNIRTEAVLEKPFERGKVPGPTWSARRWSIFIAAGKVTA